MNSDDRRLCLDFLVKVAGRSKGDAKRYFGTLGAEKIDRLLRHSAEWKLLGAPTRESGWVSLDSGYRAVDGVSTPIHQDEPLGLLAAPDEPENVSAIPLKVKTARPAKQKKIMFSILLPPSDLEALRALSDTTGETVAFHIRTAIKRYLKAADGGEL